MKLSKFAAAAAALSLATAPVVASAATVDRAAAPVTAENDMGDRGSIGILALFAIAALAIGIFADEDDIPLSA